MNNISKKERMVSYFYQHIVPIYFCFQKGDIKHQFIITSFAFSVSGYWFLITAGHCFKLIREEFIDNGWTLSSCSLIDFLGLNVKFMEPIPFNFDINKAYFFPENDDDYSFDYGVYPLSSYYKELLLANNIKSLNEEVWKKQPNHIDVCAIIGIPSELINFNHRVELVSCFLYADIIDEKPEGFKDTSLPRIYAKINLDNGMGSIEGISGGPLLGFQKLENGELRYWLLGLQSRWYSPSQHIAACPTKILGLMLESTISKS
ncbi:MAG: hypothetical protein JXC36_07185 [Candidatus Atribacteria bacterium]|nr:hypothetical protein [Candidatus Atribacteria bacterium]